MRNTMKVVLALAMFGEAITPCVADNRSHQCGRHWRDAKKNPAAVVKEVTRVSNGVIRRITANESSDVPQISNGSVPALVRTRSTPAAAFAILQPAAPGQLHGQFLEVRAGAEIRYTADDPSLVQPLQT